MAENKQNTGEWEHPYMSFDEAFKIAMQIKKMGGVTDTGKLAQALNMKKGGWLAIQIATLRRWNLVEGRGDLKLSDYFQRMTAPRQEGDEGKAKIEVFMKVPLFKNIYEKYRGHGLPEEPYFANALKSDYGLKGRNPTLVANIIKDFISKYIPGYGSNELEIEQTQPKEEHAEQTTTQKETPVNLKLDGEYPIKILTKDGKPFDWDIHTEEDWTLVETALKAIKARWKKQQDEKK